MSPSFCFVGAGAIAGVHAEILAAEGAVLDSVVGRLPEPTAEFAEKFGFCHHTTDLDAALARDGVDAVLIASPSELHYDQTLRALAAGKHVLAEIPLAMSHAAGARLVEEANHRGLRLMVCHSQRFIPALAAARRRVAEGALRVHHLIARFGIHRRENVGWTGRRRSWADNLLWHHGCHLVDFSLWFVGAEEVSVLGQVAPPDADTGIPQDLDILLRTPSNQLISLSLSYNTHLAMDEYVIVGAEESLRFQRGCQVEPEGAGSAEGADQYQLAWEAQDREFLAAIAEGRAPDCSGAEALPALAVLQEVQDRFVQAR